MKFSQLFVSVPQLLKRMLYMQVDAFGQTDPRVAETESKIASLQSDDAPPGEGAASSDSIIGTKKIGTRRLLNPFKSMRKRDA